MPISDLVECPVCGERMSESALYWHPFNCDALDGGDRHADQ